MNAPPGRLLKMQDVVRETSLSRWTIQRRINDGTFPRPYRLTARRVAWAERDIENWKTETLEKAPA